MLRIKLASIICAFLFVSALISVVYAEEESFLNQFLGSPLLALVAIIVIVAIAFLYRKFKR